MPQLEFSKAFLRDMKKWKRSGKSMKPFEEFIHTIEKTWPPIAKYEAHILKGKFDGIWDIHLQQNWVLLMQFDKNTVRLLRMGTHGDLGL